MMNAEQVSSYINFGIETKNLNVGNDNISTASGVTFIGHDNKCSARDSYVEGAYNEIGSLGYTVIGGNYNTKTVVLKTACEFVVGDVISLKFGTFNGQHNDCSKIVSISTDKKTLTVDDLPYPGNHTSFYDDDGNFKFRDGDGTCWSVTHQVGETVNDFLNHAEGIFNSTTGDNRYSHIEGYKNITSGKHAHVEGYTCIAGYGAHAQNAYNHASGNYSHAEGWHTAAIGDQSHTGGAYCTTSTVEPSNFIENTLEVQAGDFIAVDVGGTDYSDIKVYKVDPSLVTTTLPNGNPIPNSGVLDIGDDTTGYVWTGNTYDINTLMTRDTQGLRSDPRLGLSMYIKSIFNRKTVQAYSDYDFRPNITWVNKVSDTGTIKWYTIAINKITKHKSAYAWSGVESKGFVKDSNGMKMYESHGDGTFNINPSGGVKGFYVGDSNIVTAIINAIKSDNALKQALKTALEI